VLITVNFITKAQINELANKITLKLFLVEEVKEEQISSLIDYIDNEHKSVKAITHLSKEDSLQLIEEKYPQAVQFLSDFDINNPLPESIEIETRTLEDQQQIQNDLKQTPYNDIILSSDIKQVHNQTVNTVVNNLIQVKKFSFQVMLWMIITFIIAGGLIIFNAIKTTLYSRRQEIQIMQFVGATYKKIMTPFVLEGVLLALLAFAVNLIIMIGVGQFLPLTFGEGLKLIFSGEYLLILILQSVIIISVGVLTSLHVVNQYLNTNEIFNE
jgi:cell division transport system permease protein